MAADFDSSAPPGGRPPGDDLDADLLSAAEAVADGLWSPSTSVGDLDPGLLEQLNLINRVARVQATVPLVAGEPRLGSLASDSLGIALSRFRNTQGRPDLTKARRWGPLFIIEQVGRGSYGQVFRAWDPSLDREVALKILHAGRDSREASLAIYEGHLLARIRHANIIQVYGAAEVDGEVGIWMEFVRGRTLEQIVREDGPFSAEESSRILQTLCDALSAVHQAHLLHRDIKAANVMRAEGGRIVLLDFGAGADVQMLAPTARAGTPLYMAPEILLGAVTQPTIESDIYSLGVLGFFLVTGDFPVYATTLGGLVEAHERHEVVLLTDVRSGLPRNFVLCVQRALASREERYQRAGELLRDLRQGEEGDGSGRRRLAWLAYPAACFLAVVSALPMMGIITTIAFNTAMGRVNGFVNDPLSLYVALGFRSMVAPVFFMFMTAAGWGVLWSVWKRVVAGSSADHGTPTSPVPSDRFRALAERIVLIHLLALVGVVLAHRSVLIAATSYLTDADPSVFEPLRPENWLVRNSFSYFCSVVLFVSAISWVRLIAAAQSGILPRVWTATAAGAVVVFANVVLLVVPYRLTWQNKYERVSYDAARCYAIGERPGETLLYCPDLRRPRVKVVSNTDPRLVRQGVIESIFSSPTENAVLSSEKPSL